MADAQGEGEATPPTEAQLIARRRAEEVRVEQQVRQASSSRVLDTGFYTRCCPLRAPLVGGGGSRGTAGALSFMF